MKDGGMVEGKIMKWVFEGFYWNRQKHKPLNEEVHIWSCNTFFVLTKLETLRYIDYLKCKRNFVP